jgi:hypothetical protein
MVKTPDELFDMWINGEILKGETRKDFCEKQEIDINDVKWAFYAGMRIALLNVTTNDI